MLTILPSSRHTYVDGDGDVSDGYQNTCVHLDKHTTSRASERAWLHLYHPVVVVVCVCTDTSKTCSSVGSVPAAATVVEQRGPFIFIAISLRPTR